MRPVRKNGRSSSPPRGPGRPRRTPTPARRRQLLAERIVEHRATRPFEWSEGDDAGLSRQLQEVTGVRGALPVDDRRAAAPRAPGGGDEDGDGGSAHGGDEYEDDDDEDEERNRARPPGGDSGRHPVRIRRKRYDSSEEDDDPDSARNRARTRRERHDSDEDGDPGRNRVRSRRRRNPRGCLRSSKVRHPARKGRASDRPPLRGSRCRLTGLRSPEDCG